MSVYFTDHIGYYPKGYALTSILVSTDKLIIACLIMKNILDYYHKKGNSMYLGKSEEHFISLNLTEGHMDNIAKTVFTGVNSYGVIY